MLILDTDNCSTILVGKKASKTGKVLLAHNEDDMKNIVQMHLVPRVKHKKGETISFPDGSAVIPEVPETYSYYWAECREDGGAVFADGFVNEFGVAVVTNSMVSSKVPSDGKFNGGIGYGMRRLIAERARTAREGVEVVAGLMKEYGYYSSRCYQIADANEAWSVQLTKGNQFAARRVGDDEVYYVPNWYTIHEIDFSDTKHKNYYWSDDLVQYAIDNGWYTPKTEDYSDFDFTAAYQGENSDAPSNRLRSDLAWSHLLDGKPAPFRTFSLKATKKYGVEDLKAILRLHYHGHEEDLKKDPAVSPHRYGICRDTTVHSMVVEFNAVTELTCMWMAYPRPCAAPFVPWYLGSTRAPKGYSWMDWKTAQASHFAVGADEFRYHGGRAISSFKLLQNLMEFNYLACEEKVHGEIAMMEKEWAITKKAMDGLYTDVAKRHSAAAKALLTDYTAAQAYKAWDWAKQAIEELADEKDAANAADWRAKM